MATLNKNWLTENFIDFEYKKYVLLAWLQQVTKNFEAAKLYPFLSELIEHYRELVKLRDDRIAFLNQLPKRLSGIDLQKLELDFEPVNNGEDLLRELEEIVHYSIEQMEEVLKQGRELFERVEQKLYFEEIGVQPIANNFGFMLMETRQSPETRVYEYQVSVLEMGNDRLRGVSTKFVSTFTRSLVYTPERIRTELLKSYAFFNPPATYLVESKIDIPFEETFLPVAKRLLLRKLNQAA